MTNDSQTQKVDKQTHKYQPKVKSGNQTLAKNIDKLIQVLIAKKADHCQTKSCQKKSPKTKAIIAKPKAQTNS